jgi:hypothetical protein
MELKAIRKPYFFAKPIRGYDYVIPLLAELRNCGVNCFIAGGFARWVLSPNELTPIADDIDIYFYDQESFSIAKTVLIVNNKFVLNMETDNALTISPPSDTGIWTPLHVQLIKPHGKRVGNIFDVLDTFDLNICQAALQIDQQSDTLQGYASYEFTKGENKQVVKILTCESPLSVLVRCCKYSAKGYRVPAKELLKPLLHWDEQSAEDKAKIKAVIESRNYKEAYDLLGK